MHQPGFSVLGAMLNAASGVCIAAGWQAIRRECKLLHAVCMGVAMAASVVFLACCLRLPFSARPALAWAVVTLAAVPAALAWGQRWGAHRLTGRWLTPLWLGGTVLEVILCWVVP